MPTQKWTKVLVLLFLSISIIGIAYYAPQILNYYNQRSQNVLDVQDEVNISIIRTTAIDGVPLKALLYVTPENAAKTDQSVPLIIGCHGMSGDFWVSSDLFFTLAKLGYAVISPEFRGHGSNPAPTTLGDIEPSDVIQFLDYAEEELQFVNVSASGAFGVSMGALYALTAYIDESLDRNRMKGIVIYSGPSNITRELDAYTQTPEILGSLGFVNNIEGKNPIHDCNDTFPKNVLFAHGMLDNIVAYQCSVDLNNTLDPHGTRDDVVFYSYPVGDHGVGGSEFLTKQAIVWFDKYVRGIITDPDGIVLEYLPFSNGDNRDFQMNLLAVCCFLIVVVNSIIYFIKPSLYDSKWINARKDVREKPESPLSQVNSVITKGNGVSRRFWGNKLQVLGVYILIQFLSGVIAVTIQSYIVTELMVAGITSLVFVYYVYKNAEERVRIQIATWVNLKTAIIWIVTITGCLMIWLLFTNIPTVEDSLLLTGARIAWWPPYFISCITIQMVSTILFARYLLVKKTDTIRNFQKHPRVLEMFVVGVITFVSLMLFWFWGWFGFFKWDMINLQIFIIPVVAGAIAAVFLVFDLLSQLLEKSGKTVVLAPLIAGITMGILIGASSLILFY
jgi:dienelactone hydrolase